MEKSIFDTGFLLGVFDEDDKHHEACQNIYEAELQNALLPDVVLPELAYLVKRELNLEALITFVRLVSEGEYQLIRTTESDLKRAAEILEKYDDNNIDLVDTGIVAAMIKDAYTRLSRKNNDTITLVTGDSDYVPAVRMLVQDGFHVEVVFWSSVSWELKKESSKFIELDKHLEKLKYA